MSQYRLPGPGPGLLQRIVAAILTAVALVVVFFAGIVAWILLAGVLLVGGLALSIWVWRKRRQFEKLHAEALREGRVRRAGGDSEGERYETIEGEFIVIEKRRPRDD